MGLLLLLTETSEDKTKDVLDKIVQIRQQEHRVSTLLGYSGVYMNEKEPPENGSSESFEGY